MSLSMLPSKRYQQLVEAKQLQSDRQQVQWLPQLDRVHRQLNKRHQQQQSWWRRLLGSRPTQVKGLYLWGGVGIGKTQLMDILFEQLPFKQKRRLHFHRFMKQVHQALRDLQGTPDPLTTLAKQWAAHTQVVCFDEFVVNAISDSVLLGRLLQALFTQGVCLIATSNVAPDALYAGGLQRDLFLPAIDAIQAHCEVIASASQTDHRLEHLQQAGVFYTPLNEQAEKNMHIAYELYSGSTVVETKTLSICNRPIEAIACHQQTVWFDFKTLCGIPRSQHDYLEIAQQFKTVLIGNLTPIAKQEHNLICNLIHLIDVFYDEKVRLVLSAAVPIEQLYPSGQFKEQFARTQSRLLEMQSIDYSPSGGLCTSGANPPLTDLHKF